MVLIHNFKATSYVNAFILNGLAVGVATAVGIEVKEQLDKNIDINYFLKNFLKKRNIGFTSKSQSIWDEGLKVIIIFMVSFFSSVLTYFILHWVFGFGGGMMVSGKLE